MERHCNGLDPLLLMRDADDNLVPCDCGLIFDDVYRSVIFPHVYIPSRQEKQALYDKFFEEHPEYLEPSGPAAFRRKEGKIIPIPPKE